MQTKLSQYIYVIALLVVAALVVVAFGTGVLVSKDLVTPALSLFGTFFGATFAFRLNEQKEEQKLEVTRREAINRALFVLARQANAIRQLRKEFEKFPSEFEKAFNLPALKPPSYSDLVHTIAELDFLLDSSNPNLLMALCVEQERFHQAIESLRIRNEFYISEVQPALEKLAVNGKQVSVAEALSLLGERMFGGAMNGANIAWQHISATDESTPVVHRALLKQAKELFPGRKFVSYELGA